MYLALTVALTPVTAASGSSASLVQPPPNGAATTGPTSPTATPTESASTHSQEETNLDSRLTSIDTAIQRLTAKVEKPDYAPAWISAVGGLLGVAVGGVLAFLTQRSLLAHQQSLAAQAARSTSELEVGKAFAEWQLKQVSELYGPLNAQLGQSRALYQHMKEVLVKTRPDEFRFIEGKLQTNDPRGKPMEIKVADGWIEFRTLLHMERVYGKGYGIDDYLTEIVDAGGRMVKIIQEKAGYIRPDQKGLADVFGRYLAHYSVLKRLYDYFAATQEPANSGEKGALEPPVAVIQAAVFPRELDQLVADGLASTITELNAWRSRVGSG